MELLGGCRCERGPRWKGRFKDAEGEGPFEGKILLVVVLLSRASHYDPPPCPAECGLQTNFTRVCRCLGNLQPGCETGLACALTASGQKPGLMKCSSPDQSWYCEELKLRPRAPDPSPGV